MPAIVPQQLSLPLFDDKSCTRCRQCLPLTEFYKNRSAKDGLNCYCKVCWKILMAASDARCRDRKLRKCRETSAKVRLAAPDLVRSRYKAWYDKDGKDYHRKHRAENRERYRANNRARYQRDPQANILQTIARISKKRGAGGSHTRREWEDLKARYNGRCLWCGSNLKLTQDHIVPIKEGGTDHIWNIQPLCLRCNSRKNARHINFRPDRQLPAPL